MKGGKKGKGGKKRRGEGGWGEERIPRHTASSLGLPKEKKKEKEEESKERKKSEWGRLASHVASAFC